jgi:hypothetical protein
MRDDQVRRWNMPRRIEPITAPMTAPHQPSTVFRARHTALPMESGAANAPTMPKIVENGSDGSLSSGVMNFIYTQQRSLWHIAIMTLVSGRHR